MTPDAEGPVFHREFLIEPGGPASVAPFMRRLVRRDVKAIQCDTEAHLGNLWKVQR